MPLKDDLEKASEESVEETDSELNNKDSKDKDNKKGE